jgi:hypothetical protein
MKRQLLIAQLTMLLEEPATQHRLDRQALPAGLLHSVSAEVFGNQPQQIDMFVQPPRYRLQLTTDLVPGEEIEYAGLDGAFLTHCRLRRLRVVLWNQWLDPRVYPKPPDFTREKSLFLQ